MQRDPMPNSCPGKCSIAEPPPASAFPFNPGSQSRPLSSSPLPPSPSPRLPSPALNEHPVLLDRSEFQHTPDQGPGQDGSKYLQSHMPRWGGALGGVSGLANECSEAALRASPDLRVGGASWREGKARESGNTQAIVGRGLPGSLRKGRCQETSEDSPTRNIAHALPAKTGIRGHLLSFQSPECPRGCS